MAAKIVGAKGTGNVYDLKSFNPSASNPSVFYSVMNQGAKRNSKAFGIFSAFTWIFANAPATLIGYVWGSLETGGKPNVKEMKGHRISNNYIIDVDPTTIWDDTGEESV